MVFWSDMGERLEPRGGQCTAPVILRSIRGVSCLTSSLLHLKAFGQLQADRVCSRSLAEWMNEVVLKSWRKVLVGTSVFFLCSIAQSKKGGLKINGHIGICPQRIWGSGSHPSPNTQPPLPMWSLGSYVWNLLALVTYLVHLCAKQAFSFPFLNFFWSRF